jgi:K+-transporting ATPase KdpF subunit
MLTTIWQGEFHDAGSGLCHLDAGIHVPLFAPGEIPGGGFEMMEIITAILALALVFYLFISIFKPEKF